MSDPDKTLTEPEAEEFERKRAEARSALADIEIHEASAEAPAVTPDPPRRRSGRPAKRSRAQTAPAPSADEAREIVHREVAERVARQLSSERFMTRVAALLRPLGIDPDRWVKIALGTVMRNEKLMIAAKTNPAGLLHALTRAAEFGVDPSGACAEAYLVPFWNSKRRCYDIQLIIGYNGLRKLARRYGGIFDARAHLVHEKDDIKIRLGTDQETIEHTFNPKQDRGRIVGAYCKVWRQTPDGNRMLCFVEYMTREEIEANRRRSKAADSGPWVTDFGEMARKAVTKRALKQFILAPDNSRGRAFASVLEHEDEDAQQSELIAQVEEAQRTALSAPEPMPDTAASAPPPDAAEARSEDGPSAPQDQTDTPELPF